MSLSTASVGYTYARGLLMLRMGSGISLYRQWREGRPQWKKYTQALRILTVVMERAVAYTKFTVFCELV
jgi:hypothetical protein